MKKYLKIKKKPDYNEYTIKGKGGFIGDIAKGEIFKKRFVLYPEEKTEWTGECLRQVADFLDELEKKQMNQ